MEPSRVAPLPPSTAAAGPVIGKEDDETEGYGAACSVGVLNPPKNRNRTDWYFWVVKIPPFTPNTTPIKEIEDLESNQCTISILPKIRSPICMTLTLEIESNGICVFFFFLYIYFFTFLTLSRWPLSLSVSVFLTLIIDFHKQPQFPPARQQQPPGVECQRQSTPTLSTG